MQLETYISDLLYRYECVTIPEFGAFLTQRVSVSINDSTNTFYPPSKSVAFNEQIQTNDGLLAHYIADVEKIPFEVANKKIAKRVKILKSYLTQGETLTFKNIGDISLNNESKILFEPTYNLNYLTDSFGLSQFVSPAVNREIYKTDVENIEKVVPIAITSKQRKARPYLRYAAVALIALALGGFAASNYHINNIKAHNQLAQEEAELQLDNQIQQATFSLNPLPTVTLNVSKQTGNYHIVAGAFRVEENSIKKIKQLKAEGFKARKLGVNKYGLHEVVYGSYEDRLEALKALRTIKNTHNKDAWLKVKNVAQTTVVKNTPKKVSQESIEQFEQSSLITNPGKGQLISKDTFFNQSPNITPIIKEVDNLKSGFYTIIGVFSNISDREEFISNLSETGQENLGFFFDKKSQNYLIYNERFNDLSTAKAALLSEKNTVFNGEIAVVKVEN
ncbi:HU domain-containing protein [Seonamhaeicola aphaedonensis]|uniref:Sporulation related protein n=1 Tax=Seonamhaeicola aphaedonensis TaxID=1461338 RepID=A0A3D9HHC2_9FLAO|nr:SPOR domain-containing protein [Seonamhaeicola aphaedonensis]RED48897.1 sporulation related protein [Seonamhaeicola aphaedonensis]